MEISERNRMSHFEQMEATARAANHLVQRLRRELPKGRQDELLGTLETLIAATATTARAGQDELKHLRRELAALQARVEGLEKAQRQALAQLAPFG